MGYGIKKGSELANRSPPMARRSPWHSNPAMRPSRNYQQNEAEEEDHYEDEQENQPIEDDDGRLYSYFS